MRKAAKVIWTIHSKSWSRKNEDHHARPGMYLGVFRTAGSYSNLLLSSFQFNAVEWDQAKSRDVRWHLQTCWHYLVPSKLRQRTQCHVPYSQDAWTSRLFSAKYMISWFGYATHLSQEASVYCQQQGRKQLAISWTICPEAFPKVPSSSFEEWVAGDVGQCRLKASPHDKVVFPMNQLLHSADAKKTCDSKVACHDVDRNLMELPVFIKKSMLYSKSESPKGVPPKKEWKKERQEEEDLISRVFWGVVGVFACILCTLWNLQIRRSLCQLCVKSKNDPVFCVTKTWRS